DKTGILITGNVYGYQINISHPSIKPLYDRFKKWKGIPDWCPLSDEERFEFEKMATAIPPALDGGLRLPKA
ncbi:MAG: hypothetical protein II453_09560, partial [Alphaproteobacteria bacterium]|nr:hypothetical protein [Alphaproteobacteria bacterium]